MNKLSSGKNSTPLLVVALILALLFAVYYYLILPKQNEVSAMQNSFSAQKVEISSLQERIEIEKATQEDFSSDLFTLRKKVPESRSVDTLLFNIEEMEFMSGTRIQSISFNNYDSLVSSSGLIDPNYEAPAVDNAVEGQPVDGTRGNGASAEQTEADATIQAPISTIVPELLPAELKLLTLGLNVEAPSYEALLSFIREVEGLERVVRIDTISYSLLGEELDYNPEVSPIVTASIQVTAFYYEGN